MPGAITDLAGADSYVLQTAIGAYTRESYTKAKKIINTGITVEDPQIAADGETYIGQLRWKKPLNPAVNVASLTDSTDGTTTGKASGLLRYIKTARTVGATNVNLSNLLTQEDGLLQFGQDLAETRAQDGHDALLSILKGVAIAEALNGAAAGSGATGLGGQTFDNDPEDSKYGFYVDLGAVSPVIAATAAVQGAARAQGFLDALGMAFKDNEPSYMYLIASPRVMSSLRSANLVDSNRVVDGTVELSTIFDGKFRLIQTRATQGLTTAQLTKMNTGAGVDIVGTNTTFLVHPGAVAKRDLDIDVPVEIARAAAAYKGGGTTTVWNRWGYVLAPAGYDWDGSEQAFPSNDNYMETKTNAGTPAALTAATDGLALVKGVWVRKFTSALSLGILPIFHA